MPGAAPPPSPLPHFETDRLSVADWRPSLADPAERKRLEAALEKILTSAVTAHLPPPLQKGSIAQWIDARAAESWCMTLTTRAEGRIVGLLILAAPTPPDLQLGYLLNEEVWGQGLASELLQGVVRHLPQDSSLRLVAGVDPGNPASARVLEKAGFARQAAASTEATLRYVFPPQPA